jgi:hypothetical protein
LRIKKKTFKKATYHPIPWRDSISRPIDPVSSVADGDNSARPRRQGELRIFFTKGANGLAGADPINAGSTTFP